MRVHETRSTKIAHVVINIDAVRRLARFFIGLLGESSDKDRSSVSFRVSCGDGSHYSSATMDLFDEDSPVLLKRPESIEMTFSYYPTSLNVALKLRHGDSDWSNSFYVSGDDPNWVNGAHRRGQELIQSLSPQNTFIRRFGAPIFLVLALSCGFIMMHAFIIVRTLFGSTASSTDAATLSLGNYILAWLMIGAIGAVPAFELQQKLTSLWPSVEVQIGPEHNWIEKRRKGWLAVAAMVVVIPLLRSFVYDILKNVVRK